MRWRRAACVAAALAGLLLMLASRSFIPPIFAALAELAGVAPREAMALTGLITMTAGIAGLKLQEE